MANFRRYHKPLSLRVSRVLDGIGASQKRQIMRMETSLIAETINTLNFYKSGQKMECFIFGSFCEGTATQGMESDIDALYSYGALEVFQDILELPTKRHSLLLVSDSNTKPGYTKLQFCSDGIPVIATPGKTNEQFVTDKIHLKADGKNRLVICKDIQDTFKDDIFEKHGPAFSLPRLDGCTAVDYVPAYRCQTWPKMALDWCNRERHYGWPDETCIKKMKSLGFFVVGVGHPHSFEEDMEWRVSLSHQEKFLMYGLNSTQFKCYILLKMLKNHILFPLVGEESISSYHCKTSLFYHIENTPSDLWRPENLLACVAGCLDRIYRWVLDGNCPNYFIPEENMFDRRINRRLQDKLQEVLHRLLLDDFMYLLSIRFDIFGILLGHTCIQRPLSMYALGMFAGKTTMFLYSFAVRASTQIRNHFLRSFYSSNVDRCVELLFYIVSWLKKKKTVTCHSELTTKKAVSLILPYLELSLLSNILVHHVTYSTDERITTSYLLSNKWKEIGLSSDRFSAYLKQATFMYMLGYHEASLEVLNAVEESYDVRTRSMCFCDATRRRKGKCEDLVYKIHKDNLSQEDFLRNFWAPCVVFLPTEKQLIPQALRYEMFRSCSMPANSRNETKTSWYDWAVVDGKVLMYFLLYLNHSKLEMSSKTRSYITKLRELLKTDSFLCHIETDLNLLGWVLKKENLAEEAAKCFESSIRVQKQHNAATLHLQEKSISECEDMVLKAKEGKPVCEEEDNVTVIYSRT